MAGPARHRALFATVTAAMVLAVLALGSLPAPTRVERAAAESGAVDAVARRERPRVTTPITEAPPVTIAPGLDEVGPSGVRPGVYVATGELCSWERRGPGGEVVAGDTASGQVLVEVRPGDTAFSSSPGCGLWRAFDAAAALPAFDSGTFAVGTQVAPGRWRSDGGDLCYWERLSGLGGGLDELVASAGVPGPTEVVVAPTDAAFSSFGCGTWRPAH
jgi:hypothetical protein